MIFPGGAPFGARAVSSACKLGPPARAIAAETAPLSRVKPLEVVFTMTSTWNHLLRSHACCPRAFTDTSTSIQDICVDTAETIIVFNAERIVDHSGPHIHERPFVSIV